jgi:hypothetical protein
MILSDVVEFDSNVIYLRITNEHLRVTRIYKNTDHQQMHKESFIINRNTLLHVSALLDHLQGELFVIVTLRFYFIVE